MSQLDDDDNNDNNNNDNGFGDLWIKELRDLGFKRLKDLRT